jgi:hypothetical protein
MSSQVQPIATQPAVVYTNWLQYLQNWAAEQNQAAVTQYQAALSNWNLNAPIYKALGIAGPPQPLPPMSVAVNVNAQGVVGQPEFITTTTPVCAPPAPAAPAAAVTSTPGLGAAMDAAGIYFACKAGDNAPNGYILHVNGASYQKYIVETPFGVRQYYQKIS